MALTEQDIETIEKLIARRLREELGFRPDASGAGGQTNGRVWDALHELAQAQARTEQHLEELAQAIGELCQAQARTEKRVEELAEAQARTEERVEELARAVAGLARQVGGLSDAIGGDIEDIAYIVLHGVLKREFGWDVGVLGRVWQTWGREPEEVNIFGQAADPRDPSRQIWVVGEAKHNLTVKQVERFVKQLARSRVHLSGEIFPVCFCYRARPEVQTAIREAGIRLVFSYGQMV